jgi:hypothetical protein
MTRRLSTRPMNAAHLLSGLCRQTGNAENQAALAAAAKAEFRWIPQGSPITRDYRLTRLNVELDENNVIMRIACF